MMNEEKLRALLAEARESVEADASFCVALMPDGTSRSLAGLLQRIDAALAEPVRGCESCGDKTYREVLDDNVRVRQERDEARAEVERLRGERLQFDPGGSDKIDELEDAVKYLRAEVEHWKGAAKEYAEGQDDARAEVEKLRIALDASNEALDYARAELLPKARVLAFQRGAEAMREAAAKEIERQVDALMLRAGLAADIRALPVPEDNP